MRKIFPTPVGDACRIGPGHVVITGRGGGAMATDTVPLKQYPEWVRGTAYIDGYEIVLDAIFRLLGIVEVAQNAKSLREYLRWQAGRGAISTSIPEDDQKCVEYATNFLAVGITKGLGRCVV
jgi:hypothetical protein